MSASVSSISGIPVLGRPSSWFTLKFIVWLVVSHSTAHTCCRANNFTDISFAKRDLAVNTLRKVKSVKTTPSNGRFVHISKSIQDLV
jgi:hypothetical protein